QRAEELAAGKVPRAGRQVAARDAGEVVRRGGRPAAGRRGADRRSLRAGLLAGGGAAVHWERFGDHAPGGGGGHAGTGTVRADGPRGLGAARAARAGGAMGGGGMVGRAQLLCGAVSGCTSRYGNARATGG